jgi:hypothetical protein
MYQTKSINMRIFTPTSSSRNMLLLLFLLINFSVFSQVIMFDDFNYVGNNDPQLSSFNKWNIINGVSGPPEGGYYSSDNVNFINDPASSTNRLMTLRTTVNGASKAVTHARIETGGFEYFEGTYAARVYLSDDPFTYKDANIQTFYTIVSSSLAMDGSKYSELDIVEYMAADKWGTSTDNRVMYTTSYHKYRANPWAAWKTYFARPGSFAGWHTFVASCTDGVNVRYWMDDIYLGSHATTDGNNPDGATNLSVYPRSNMQVAFANWIWNNITGSSAANRNTTMQADWVLYYKNQALSVQQVNDQVAAFRAAGVQRRNLSGQVHIGNTGCQPIAINPYLSVNGGGWQNTSSATLAAGGSIVIGPQPLNGTWRWTGPNGFASTSRQISLSNIQTSQGGNYTATYTNPCGAQSTLTFTITVTGGGGTFTQTIEAENYTYMSGVIKETCSEGGQNIGSFDASDWTSYNISIPTAGTYKISYRVASIHSGRVLRLEKDNGATLLGSVTIPNTGNWQLWTSVSHTVTLPAGAYAIGFATTTGGFNINKFTIANNLAAREVLEEEESVGSMESIYPNPVESTISLKSWSHFKSGYLRITDVSGREHVMERIVSDEVNVSTLHTGLYVLRLMKGKQSLTRKFYKK